MHIKTTVVGSYPVPRWLIGDASRFTREDSVEECWRILAPLLEAPPPVEVYEPGSWGPPAADHLIARDGGWRAPWTSAPT